MTMRSATPEDIDDVLELLRADEEHLIGRPSRIGRSDLLQWLGRIDLGEDSWLLEEDGRLVACGWAQTRNGGFANWVQRACTRSPSPGTHEHLGSSSLTATGRCAASTR